MKRLLIISVVFFVACNSQTETKSENTADTLNNSVETSAPSINGCYMSILKQDTATLRINENAGLISGDLTYDRFEKDSNKGTFKGEIKDSLIIGDYTFQSEGNSSVRQVVFKISGANLIEGYGDINMNGDTATFKNISHLNYQNDQPFIKTDCK
jgi:hypothetical protein